MYVLKWSHAILLVGPEESAFGIEITLSEPKRYQEGRQIDAQNR